MPKLDEIIQSRLRGKDISPASESWQHKRMKIMRRDGYACVACGRTKKLEVHHLIKRSNNGPDLDECLITLCHECHKRIESGIMGKAVRDYIRYL